VAISLPLPVIEHAVHTLRNFPLHCMYIKSYWAEVDIQSVTFKASYLFSSAGYWQPLHGDENILLVTPVGIENGTPRALNVYVSLVGYKQYNFRNSLLYKSDHPLSTSSLHPKTQVSTKSLFCPR
jgi:hypothetical protein